MLITTPRDYQARIIKRALKHPGFGIFGEQRTGKCLMSLAIIDQRKPDLVLIICPVAALQVWESQIKEHLKIDWDIRFESINFEKLNDGRAYKKWRRQLMKAERPMVIVDECHRIKRRGSKQGRRCRGLGKKATYRLALTGTPISKRRSLEDAWAQFDFIQCGHFFKSFESFAERYLKYGGFKGKKVVGYRRVDEFQKKFHQLSARITLREARQEPLLIRRTKILIDQPPPYRRIARELESQLKTVVNRRKVKIPQIMNLSMKLQQLSGGFVIAEGGEVVPVDPQVKLLALKALLFRLRGRKTVICARFSHEIRAISLLCKKLGLSQQVVEGGQPWSGQFSSDTAIIQIQAGISIDLAQSNDLIMFSWDFSYINHEQMLSRVLSYDTKQVSYYYLILKGSIDPLSFRAIRAKKNLASLICDQYRK